jgi:hypothetical protein
MTPTLKHLMDIIEVRSPRPTELFELMPMFTQQEIQDVLVPAIYSGEIILSSDRHLKIGAK